MRYILVIFIVTILYCTLLAEELPPIDKNLLLKELNRQILTDFESYNHDKNISLHDFHIKEITNLEKDIGAYIKIFVDKPSFNKFLELRRKFYIGRQDVNYFSFRNKNREDPILVKSEEDLGKLIFYFGSEPITHVPFPLYTGTLIDTVYNDVALALHATLKEIERQKNRFFSFRKEIHFGNLLFEDRGDYLIVSSESTGKKNDNWRCHIRKFSNEVIKFYFPHKKPQDTGEITKVEQEIVMIIHATFTEYEKHFNILEGYSKGKRVLFGVHIGDLIIEERNDHFRIFPKGIEGIIGGGFNCCIQKGTYEVIKFVRGK